MSDNILESDGYWHYCNDCGARWDYLDYYCPHCGSGDIDEGHLIECDCEECREFINK